MANVWTHHAVVPPIAYRDLRTGARRRFHDRSCSGAASDRGMPGSVSGIVSQAVHTSLLFARQVDQTRPSNGLLFGPTNLVIENALAGRINVRVLAVGAILGRPG